MQVVTIRWLRMESFMKTSRLDRQPGQDTPSVLTGAVETSLSQWWYLNCMMGVMKPLILILLLATVTQAQTIVDAARKECERQARVETVRVFTPESARKFLPLDETAKPAEGETAPAPAEA